MATRRTLIVLTLISGITQIPTTLTCKPMDDQLGQVLLKQELQRVAHEDPTVQRALTLLKDDDYPTVPVRTYDDPKKLYAEVLQKLGEPELTPNAVGAVPLDKSAIYINTKSQAYTDPYKLASKIAHEQVHVKAPNWDRRESPAYERELAFVDSNLVRFDKNYRAALIQMLKQLQKEKR